MSTFRVTSRTLAILAATAALSIPAAGVAAASTTITPAGSPVTAASNSLRLTTAGGISMLCTNVSGNGSVPVSNNNPGTGGIHVPISTVTLSGCTLQGIPATVTTAGGWTLNADHDGSSPSGRIVIPASGAAVTSGPCSISVGASTAGPLPYDNVTGNVTASNSGTINFVSNGVGAHCPPAGAGTATMTGTLKFTTPSGPPVVAP